MAGWIILGVVLLLIVLLLLLRVEVSLSYGQEGFRFEVRLQQLKFTLYPWKKGENKGKVKKKKPPQKKEKKPAAKKAAPTAQKPTAPPEKPVPAGQATPAPSKAAAPPEGKSPQETTKSPPAAGKGEGPAASPKAPAAKQAPTPSKDAGKKESSSTGQGGAIPPVTDLISLAFQFALPILSRIQIDVLRMDCTIAGKADPASAAIQYGLIYAGTGGLIPVLENLFYRIKRREIDARVDFQSEESLIWLQLILSVQIRQLLVLAAQLGWAYWKLISQPQEENKHGTEASDQ